MGFRYRTILEMFLSFAAVIASWARLLVERESPVFLLSVGFGVGWLARSVDAWLDRSAD